MLFLIVLPVMGAASYWSKREDNKLQKDMNKKDTEKVNTSIGRVSDQPVKLTKPGLNLDRQPVVKPFSIIQELNKTRSIHEVFAEENSKRLKAERGREKNESDAIHLPASLYESFKNKVSLMVRPRLGWITGISLGTIFSYRIKRFKARFKRNDSTAITLWKPEVKVHATDQELIQSVTVSSRESKISRYGTKVQSNFKQSLPTLEAIEYSLLFKQRVMIDLFLLNYIIQQRLNELIWMGVYYSMVLANLNLHKISLLDNNLSRL